MYDMSLEIRNFKQEDMPLLREFYQVVTKDRKVVFWWVGPEGNWANVFCAFDNGKMVAKGQVEVINNIHDGSPKESRHSIYFNLKTLPEREEDFEVINLLYERVYARGLELKQQLSSSYQTNLCFGNFATEVSNNSYFVEEKGFKPLNTLYTMERNLQEPIEASNLPLENVSWQFWKMDSLEEEKQYLEVESQIWPDTALGLQKLHEYKRNPSWTSIPVRDNGKIIASAMAWQEEDMGVIEDVFVIENWRKLGIAKFLLTTGLTYLKEIGLDRASLMVDTENENALNLYRSVGFHVVEEERRYFITLD
ncbi:GNAT family N-acetyltransferase [Ornithinibacillus californiensis]|uniref:GNAT family N-acetyltransferase n=1 Tax=Ornithinibacillus californiensis TaxID=161536 RepID=UPI00064DBD15|nr:GNAT family N-acetyltransferase [Ornithinibacillus californiensis]